MGIIDLRGENIPVVDLRSLLNLEPLGDTPNTRILVTLMDYGTGSGVVGVRTDRVIEVTRMDDDEIRPLTEAELLRWDGAAIAGIGRRNGDIVSVLDLDHLFGDPAILAEVSNSASVNVE
jgi:purine-binding chemotaxis protein CheW